MLLHVVGSLSFKILTSCQIKLIKIERERNSHVGYEISGNSKQILINTSGECAGGKSCAHQIDVTLLALGLLNLDCCYRMCMLYPRPLALTTVVSETLYKL